MCGICGSLSLNLDRVDPDEIGGMLAALAHRGPDAEGLFAEPGVAAGIRRLAVFDVAGGDQPIANEDGSVQVVFNGEIYNFAELREQLTARGHRFRTRADTEVLVHLWEEEGPELVHRLNGMFAFCLHDSRLRETFLARDRLGIKPLFISASDDGERLVFASELAALLRHPGVRDELDLSLLPELFCLQYLSGDETLYRHVKKLLPGHAVHIKNGKARTYRYYGIPDHPPVPEEDLEARARTLRRTLESSVRYRRIADVPLGVFLSGGIDSSIVVALLSTMSDQPVETFSVGFSDPAAFDEREQARLVSEHYRTEHHELVVSPVQIAEHLPELIGHLAEPVLDPAIIPTYVLSRFAREHVTVVLTGEGADELFGGYRRYLYQQRYGWLARLPGFDRAGALGRVVPRRVEQALEALALDDPARKHLRWASTVGAALATRLLGAEAYDRYESRVAAAFAPYFPVDHYRLADPLRADQHEWLPHNLLAKVDRASMAFSLEARVPFLDHRLVEWAAGLPDDLKIRSGVTKFILRKAFEGRIPPAVARRPKQGFDLPLASWIRGPLRGLVDEFLMPHRLKRWEILEADQVREMLSLHREEKQDFGLPLFNLLSIMIFLDGRL
jgi:asparagine synthase (glutamine-hydrolysing)